MDEDHARLTTSTSPERQRQAARLAVVVALALDEANCEDVRVLDVRGLSQVTDYIVIGSGASDRQIRTAIAKADAAAKEMGETAFGGQRDGGGTWLIIDFVDVVVHVFEPGTRAMYDLEMLWGDAPQIDWAADRPKRPRGTPR